MDEGKLKVRAAKQDEYRAIAGIIGGALGNRSVDDWLTLWRWRFDKNPARREGMAGYFVGEAGGRIVGAHGLTPSRIKIGDQIVSMMYLSDFAVDPDYRGKGYGKKIRIKVLSRETSPFTVSTSSNKIGNKVTLSLGGKEMAAGRRKFIKPVHSGGFIKNLAERKKGLLGLLLKSPLGNMLSAFLDLFLRIMDRRRLVAPAKGAVFENIDNFDERFDVFWEKTAADYPVLFVRDSAYLNWRYRDYPFPGIKAFCLVKDDEIRGFAVTHSGQGQDNLHFCTLLEMFLPRKDEKTFRLLMSEVITRARKQQADYITALNSVPEWDKLYRTFGFKARFGQHSPYTYNNNAGFPAEIVDNPDNWHISLGDGDMCFY